MKGGASRSKSTSQTEIPHKQPGFSTLVWERRNALKIESSSITERQKSNPLTAVNTNNQLTYVTQTIEKSRTSTGYQMCSPNLRRTLLSSKCWEEKTSSLNRRKKCVTETWQISLEQEKGRESGKSAKSSSIYSLVEKENVVFVTRRQVHEWIIKSDIPKTVR